MANFEFGCWNEAEGKIKFYGKVKIIFISNWFPLKLTGQMTINDETLADQIPPISKLEVPITNSINEENPEWEAEAIDEAIDLQEEAGKVFTKLVSIK